MVAFLCLFFPPVIAVALSTKIRRENFDYYQCLVYYAVFAVIINGIMFWILSFMFDPHSISSPDVFTTSFSAKYISLSSILAVVSAYVMKSLRKHKSGSTDLIQEKETQEKTDKDD
jgi:drug/metabolite transporter (DMT)-like permease